MCTIWLVGPQKSAAFTYAPYCTIYVHLSKPHTNISGNHFYISDLSNSNIKNHPSVIFWNLEFIPSLSSGLSGPPVSPSQPLCPHPMLVQIECIKPPHPSNQHQRLSKSWPTHIYLRFHVYAGTFWTSLFVCLLALKKNLDLSVRTGLWKVL